MVSNVFNYLVILIVTIQFLSIYGSNTSKLISFSTYLIHRDSLESLLYNSSTHKTNLLEQAIRRSSSRLSYLKSISKFPNNAKETNVIDSTIVVSSFYEYLIEIFIGTPPIKQLVVFDTGSDHVWTQCLPCVNCFKQTQPKFNSKMSLSYKILKCGANECKKLGDDKTCTWFFKKCGYTLEYKDNSFSSGELAMETYKLGNTFFQNMVYGCSKNNIGVYHHSIAGIAGFGPGPHSLISQLGDRVGGKFAYCLVHHLKQNTRSKISFGDSAIVSGQSTPLESYYVTLEGISVENMTFPIIVGQEKIYTRIRSMSRALLDTGSFMSYLPTILYQQLENVLRSVIRAAPIETDDLKHCYMIYPNFPTIIFHFSRGAELVLTMRNTIVKNNGLWCLVINSIDEDEILIGSLLQMNYMIGYDLENKSVSFMPTNCSNN